MAKSILIIGDWFVDENWIVTRHSAFASSHAGDIHYLGKQSNVASHMVGLCGVPAIWGVLRSYLGAGYTVAAFGIWNTEDAEKLKCIVCKEGGEQKLRLLSPFTISGLKEVAKGNEKCAYNDQECNFHSPLINLATASNISTNRVVRVYEGHGGGEPHISYRFDWRLPVSSDTPCYKTLTEFVQEKDVAAVIIDDHNTGFISEGIISTVVQALDSSTQLGKAKWYVRARIEHPVWLEELSKQLKDQYVTLRVIDYAVALEKKGPRVCRFGNTLGRASLELLGEFSGSAVYEHQEEKIINKVPIQKTAVLFDDNTVIGKDSDLCYDIRELLGPRQLINVGRTTMFFSCLVAQDILDPNSDFATHCRKAVHGAYAWSKGVSDAWKRQDFNFYDYAGVGDLVKKTDLKSAVILQRSGYKDAWEEWNESSKWCGILDKSGRKVLQLWRGEGAVKRYICVGGEKRNQINSLLTSISAFARQKNPKHPFNCLFVSSPGWGKSYLAKCLAKECDMSFLEFSVSQMATTRDLIDSFDSICSHQNRTDRKVLIFLDEVNCEIEGNLAMGLLLSPIWDGSFIRDGKYYRLLPAVWIFASTAPLHSLDSLANSKSNKGSDFVSRLNGPIIDLDSGKHGNIQTLLDGIKRQVIQQEAVEEAIEKIHRSRHYKKLPRAVKEAEAEYMRTEMVYICVSLLDKLWGPISSIEEQVLRLFYHLVPINGIRGLEFFVSKFQYIQRGVVRSSNVPLYADFPELLRHVVYPPGWKNGVPGKTKHTDLIDIETMFE